MFDEEKGWYFSQILQATEREDWYLQQLILQWRQLRYSKDRAQRNSLLGNLMKRGNGIARRELDRIWKEQLQENNIGPLHDFIEYGTPNDYRTVLQHCEAAWQNRRKPHPDVWYIHLKAEDGIGKKRAAKIRQSFLTRNPKFAKIADFPECKIEKPYAPLNEDKTVEECILAATWVPANLLDADGLARVVKLMQTNLQTNQLRSAIRVFNKFPFPGDIQILLNFLDHENEQIVFTTLNALQETKSALIREALFSRTFEPSVRCTIVSALSSSFEPGDERWVKDQLDSIDDTWDQHIARMSMFDVVRKNPKGDWINLLQEAYEFSACQICRSSFAEHLHKRRALPRLELEALQHDAFESTRTWATKELHKLDRKAGKATA